jgi:hypothetical protein
VSGFAGLLSTVDLIVSGNLEVGVQGFVRLAGGFSISQQSGVAIDDGAGFTGTTGFTGDVLSLNLNNVFLFVGTGAGAFSYDVNDIVDGIDTTNAIGFLAADAGLGLSIISETTGTRSWMAIAGHIALMTPAGANEFTLAAKNLDLLYNGAASDGSKLDWDALTTDPTDPVVSGFAGLLSTVDLIVSGNLEVGVQGFVRRASCGWRVASASASRAVLPSMMVLHRWPASLGTCCR